MSQKVISLADHPALKKAREFEAKVAKEGKPDYSKQIREARESTGRWHPHAA